MLQGQMQWRTMFHHDPAPESQDAGRDWLLMVYLKNTAESVLQ